MVQELSKYKKVDCYGEPHGNWFYDEGGKIDLISKYKFNICFENSIHPGYYTEKPIHAKYASPSTGQTQIWAVTLMLRHS